MSWPQRYDPLGSPFWSTAMAALPIVVLLGSLAWFRLRAPLAALAGLVTSIAVAILGIGMPASMAFASAALGAAYGFLPIGWIVLNVVFLYQIVERRGHLESLRRGVSSVTDDRRLQLLLVAFSFGAFMEGAAGFGTPVAVTGGILIALGFKPLEASGLALIANTAPVAFGALGTPIIALQGVTGLDLHALSAQVGRQLPVFSVIVPFWLLSAYAGWRGMRQVWPAALVAGVSFAVPQYLMATLHGPWLVDIVAAACSMACLVGFLRVWKPAPDPARAVDGASIPSGRSAAGNRSDRVPGKAWAPWIVLTILVFAWGTPQLKAMLNGISAPRLPVPGLNNLVERAPPVVAALAPEPAVFTLNWLSATGTAILLTALITAGILRFGLRELVGTWTSALRRARASLLTISLMLALGYVTRYSGEDAVLGLAFARTGLLYPFFGTMLGWLGVALTGSDTSSNVLFGSLQTITARQLGLDPVLMAAANSSGGVMGKMIDAQSIVVAGTVTHSLGQEGAILRYVFFHSIALASLVGLLVMLQAYAY
ncbi:MAG TPA: L-lactate permease [Gemmatimonadales bacterium]|nr:L-lactate permease [Gemmatimonadales bacterium]